MNAVRLAIVLCSLSLLLACGPGSAVAPPKAQEISLGQDVVTAQFTALNDRSALGKDRAITLAEHFVPAWRSAKSVNAVLVRMTAHASPGGGSLGLDAKPVWLVTFAGAPYRLTGGTDAGCACGAQFNRSNTGVALDSRTGALVVIFGSDNPS